MNTYYFNLVDKEFGTVLETARLKANSYDDACIKLYNAYCHPDESINKVEELKQENGKIIINFADFGSDVLGIRVSEAEAMENSEIIDIK